MDVGVFHSFGDELKFAPVFNRGINQRFGHGFFVWRDEGIISEILNLSLALS